MALLEIGTILADPDFSELFSVHRRQQVIDVHGRSTVVDTIYGGVIGVINAGDPNDLRRESPDYEYAKNTISLVTAFDLIGETEGYLPDIITWRGGNYTVVDINQYPQFGPGFVQATCTVMDRNDPFKLPYTDGQMALSTTHNSNLIGLL